MNSLHGMAIFRIKIFIPHSFPSEVVLLDGKKKLKSTEDLLSHIEIGMELSAATKPLGKTIELGMFPVDRYAMKGEDTIRIIYL